MAWIEEMMGVPLDQTLTLEVDAHPGNAVAERLLQGLPLSAGTKARNRSWHRLIEAWTLPGGGSPRIAVSLQRERRPKTAPATVWNLEWQEIPIALKMGGLPRHVVSVNLPVVFPPSELPILEPSRHWLIVHRQDAAALLLIMQQVQDKALRSLGTMSGQFVWKAATTGTRLCLIPLFRAWCGATSNFSSSERSGFESTACLTGGDICSMATPAMGKLP
jgi:hypothetical protein